MLRHRICCYFLLGVFSPGLWAVDEYHLEIKGHLFFPSIITIPAGEKVKLVVHNLDSTPEEFESFSLNREKVIFGNKKVTIFIGPLKPGEYEFVGEYNPNSARGTVVVVQKTQENNNVD
ncbi:cupredoxin domain-containing protein [Paraglaciecola sp.]|uniref:cupredoxin domain-containing protein n=1 Tax=Paraglaciecola sp. TaxID=1920173 RepID=UPI0030F44D76